MVLATGSGKTLMVCMITYRRLAYTPMKCVLFLVDRNNLCVAAKTALQTFTPTETGKSFADIYGVVTSFCAPNARRPQCRNIGGDVEL